jgi:hypothetical protein
MRWKLAAPSLAIAALGVSACGGGNASSSGSGSATAARSSAAAAPIHLYRVRLTGAAETPPGAPNGAGAAVIAIHSGSVVCWRFTHLRGFTAATAAHIHMGAKGKSGNVVVPLSTGPKLRHRGCVRSSAAVVTAIARNPHKYYVNIHSNQYPAGAVRAQL